MITPFHMGAKISIIPASEFMVSDIDGVHDVGQWRAHLAKLLRAAAIAGTDNLLLDIREARSPLRAFEVFSLVSVFDELVPPFAGRLAILNRPKDAFDRAEFFSKCAQRRGFDVEAFQDYEEAVQWLYPPQPLDTQIIRLAELKPK